MRGVEEKAGTRRFGFSYALLAIAVVTYFVVWGYSSYAAERRALAEVPKIDPILKLIKGLRQYQQLKGSFPENFNQVETLVWKHATSPVYGANGHSLVVSNYYYFYTFITPNRCTLWAIPVGDRAVEAPAYFLILTPEDREKWKGPPLDLKEASTISGTPTYTQLAMLGMIKQDALRQPQRK